MDDRKCISSVKNYQYYQQKEFKRKKDIHIKIVCDKLKKIEVVDRINEKVH